MVDDTLRSFNSGLTVPAWVPWWTTVGADPQRPRRIASLGHDVVKIFRAARPNCRGRLVIEVAKLMQRPAAFNVEEN